MAARGWWCNICSLAGFVLLLLMRSSSQAVLRCKRMPVHVPKTDLEWKQVWHTCVRARPGMEAVLNEAGLKWVALNVCGVGM